jgi:hypothetical protein
MLLLGNVAWMACNFARMAMCLNGLCMLPLMLQIVSFVKWVERNLFQDCGTSIILHIIMFKILATLSRFLLFNFTIFHKELWLCLSRCCNSSQSSIAYILALMQVHLISLHYNIMWKFTVFFSILWLASSAHGEKMKNDIFLHQDFLFDGVGSSSLPNIL